MKSVLIAVGGSRGIGAATAQLAVQRGYAVCISYLRNQAAADAVVDEIVRAGARATAVAADVSVASDVVRLSEHTDKRSSLRTMLGAIS